MNAFLRFFAWVRGEKFTPENQSSPVDADDAPGKLLTVMAGTDTESKASLLSYRERVIDLVNRISFPIRPGRGMTVFDPATGKPATHATDSAASDNMRSGADIAYGVNMSPAIPAAQLLWYASQTFPGYQALGICMQHWLVNKAISMPPRDAIRNGWQVVGEADTPLDPRVVARIKLLDRKYKTKNNVREYVRMGRGYGIRILLFLVDPPGDAKEYYENPFNIDAVRPGSYLGMSQIEPIWCVPELDMRAASNPMAKDFYEPTWWVINGVRIHRSHLCIYRGDEVVDTLKPSYLFGGLSVTQRIVNRVYAAERTADEAPMLAMSKRVRTLKTNLGKAIGKQADLEKMLAQRSRMMNNYGTDVIDKQEDEVAFTDTSLADLDTVIMTQFQLVAAIAECPATRLLGTTPKGFNSTGDYEQESYRETLRSMQDDDMSPLLDRHYEIMYASDIAPWAEAAGVKIPAAIYHEWEPIDVPTDAERADISLKKAQEYQIYADVGTLDGESIGKNLRADRNSGISFVPDSVQMPTGEELTGEEPDDGDPQI